MYRRDVVLSFLAAGPDDGYTNFQIQKGMFILSVRSPELFDVPYVFRREVLGPFCADIYDDARALQAMDLVSITNRFALTATGRCEAHKTAARLQPRAAMAIGVVARYADRQSLLTLLTTSDRLQRARPESAMQVKKAARPLGQYSPRLV